MSDNLDELEVELEESTLFIIERLVEEGWFRDISDGASFAYDATSADSVEGGFALDPVLEWRIGHIKKIRSETEDETLQNFFLDTSYLIREYAKLTHDEDDVETYNARGYLSGRFLDIVESSDNTEKEINRFLDKTEELTDDFWNLSNKSDAGYEEEIERYEETYFDQEDIESLLASR